MESIGGQAVIEGVMMKTRRGWAVAVRDPRGEIHVRKEPLKELPRFFRLPLVRGSITLFHTLYLGMVALEYSATKAYDEEDEEPINSTAIIWTIVLSILMGIGLFIALPLYATKLIGLVLEPVSTSSVLFNLVDGVLRVFVFLLYVVLIGMWGEIRRVFEYHGAEHKVIHAHEDGREMRADAMEDLSPLHPRCGTSFLLIVMMISILVFSMIPQDWTLLWKFLARIVLIPLIAGISYETLKGSARISGTTMGRMMVWPGLMLQRLTTREPDAGQIQVAMRAFHEARTFDRTDMESTDA